MLKKFIILAALLPSLCYANRFMVPIDLTQGKGHQFAKYYPGYDELDLSSFENGNPNLAFLGLKKHKTDHGPGVLFFLGIDTNSTGDKFVYVGLNKKCTDTTEVSKIKIKTNGFPVEYFKRCDGNFYYVFPSNPGYKTIFLKELHKETYLKMEFSDITLFFMTKGFNQSWDNFGKGAL